MKVQKSTALLSLPSINISMLRQKGDTFQFRANQQRQIWFEWKLNAWCFIFYFLGEQFYCFLYALCIVQEDYWTLTRYNIVSKKLQWSFKVSYPGEPKAWSHICASKGKCVTSRYCSHNHQRWEFKGALLNTLNSSSEEWTVKIETISG